MGQPNPIGHEISTAEPQADGATSGCEGQHSARAPLPPVRSFQKE